jgi:tetratricopeptide (TPR) repeat protein
MGIKKHPHRQCLRSCVSLAERGASGKSRLRGLICVVIVVLARSAGAQARVTFAKDIAPILFEHCASCHHPGEIGGFSLLAYEDVRPRAAAIARVTRSRLMPPWKPEPGHGEFVGARRLTEQQIETIQRWVADGAIEGDRSDLPASPQFATGWRLGAPDLIVTLRDPYVVPAGGADVLRNFVIPIPVDRVRYVSGIEFRPGNAAVVHHANLRLDRTPSSRLMDEADPLPGFDGRLMTGEFPEGHFLGWTPGQLPPLVAPGMAWRLDPTSDLVIQLHLHPGATPQAVQPSVGFFFTEHAPERLPLMLRLGRQNIDIPAGETRYEIDDEYVLPVDVDVYAVQPHAHYRARVIEGTATLPDGTRTWLISIPDWDFNWQDVYRYVQPVSLPRGTMLRMRYTYDNSTANRRNPDHPPKRVRWGQNSSDEMGDLWLQVLPRSEADRRQLRADFGPKVMAEDAVGYESMLAAGLDNVRLHQAAAAIYLSLGEKERAMTHLEAALRLDPQSVEANYNLGLALASERRFVESTDRFSRALALQPDHVAARVNLGAVLRAQGRVDEAIEQLREALRIDASNATAHTNLAGALASKGRVRAAIGEYRSALGIKPDSVEPLTSLAWILATSPDRATRSPSEAVQLAEHATVLTNSTDSRALDTLAAARAAAGDFRRAIESAETALEVAVSRGLIEDARLIRARTDLYRHHRPYRDPMLGER